MGLTFQPTHGEHSVMMKKKGSPEQEPQEARMRPTCVGAGHTALPVPRELYASALIPSEELPVRPHRTEGGREEGQREDSDPVAPYQSRGQPGEGEISKPKDYISTELTRPRIT